MISLFAKPGKSACKLLIRRRMSRAFGRQKTPLAKIAESRLRREFGVRSNPA
jgi:hypothetical protein